MALRGMPALFSPPHRDVPRTTHSCGLTCESNGFPPVWFWGCGLNSFRLEFFVAVRVVSEVGSFPTRTETDDRNGRKAGEARRGLGRSPMRAKHAFYSVIYC